jgi:hypothetical protein
MVQNTFSQIKRHFLTILREYCSYRSVSSLNTTPYKLAAFLLTVIFVSTALSRAEDVEVAEGVPVVESVPVAEDGAVAYASGDLPEAGDSDIGESLLAGHKVDVYAGSSFIYDSNTSQTPVAQSASLFAFSYGFDVKRGDSGSRGGYYGFDYGGQAFAYTDAATALGRDPFEHSLGSYIGVNGGLTKIRFDLDYHRTNGNSLQFDQIQRETRRIASNDYNFNLSIVRDISRVSLEMTTGYLLRDFDAGTGLGSSESSFGDIAAFVTPSFAPKTNIGGGFRFGTDNYDVSVEQNFFTPSVRWRYQLSSKTSLHSSLGYEFRSSDAPGSVDSENLVYNGGVNWNATSKTTFGLDFYRRVTPSYLLAGEDSTLTGASLRMSNRLPGQFRLSTRLGYEDAGYFANGAAVSSGREDQFLRLSMDLSHPLRVTEKVRGEWGLFYNHNQNDSTLAPFEFEQNVVGARVVLVY